MELVAEFHNHPPVPSELGPVLHPDDVAAGKTTALDGRAEVRDAIDVDRQTTASCPGPSRPGGRRRS